MLREIQKGPHALALACGALLACGGDDAAAGPRGGGPALTYYGDAKAIVDARCATCHSPGNIGPFSLTSYEDVETYAVPMRAAIALGTMPPWQPADECNDYAFNFDLTPEERQTLLDFLDQGAPEGDPADAPEGPGPDALPGSEADLPLRLPEAARHEHEKRAELDAVARLIELELLLTADDRSFQVTLLKELGRLRRDELMDDAGARSAFARSTSATAV